MSLKILFGKKLKQLRKERGLTQEKLAELLDLETGTIGMIEIGKRATSFETLEKIAKTLDIKYSELFDIKIAKTPNALQAIILDELDGLEEKELEHILNYVKEFKRFLQ